MDYIDEYLKSMATAGRKPSTINAAKGTLHRFEKVIGKKNLLDVDRDEVELFILDLQQTMNKRFGIYQRLNAVKIFYDFLVEDLEVLTRNPIKKNIKRIDKGKITNKPLMDYEKKNNHLSGYNIFFIN